MYRDSLDWDNDMGCVGITFAFDYLQVISACQDWMEE